jgi:vesicular inhibitory amino acid transporter
VLTTYSGSLFSRLYQAVPTAVLFGDIGKKAAGARGRNLVYGIIYSLDATRCVILHLAATQSLQHALGASAPPMWQCGLAVMVMAGIATQIRALARLSWFFLTGTTAQLVAIGIVVYELLRNPDPEAKTELVRVSGHYERQFVAIFNMVFAYGGQFAFTELMTDMKLPTQFFRAISVCTLMMTTLYAGVASAGYWSKGLNVADIVIFSLGESPLARLAAGCILIQALAQYLVNLNVWTHNLLVLLGRSLGHEQSAVARSAAQHCQWRWLGASLFVVLYSWLISMSVPYFSSLVGIVASSTYLVCAYTLPCWFGLKLLGGSMWKSELWFCHFIIPFSLLLSAAGFYSSVHSLIDNIRSQGSGFGPPV